MDPAALVLEFGELVSTKYCFLAAYTVLVYEAIICLSSEVRCVWGRKKGFVDFLYLLARYGVLACVPVIFSAYFSPLFSPEVCKHFSLWVAFYALALFIIPSIIMIVRVYAIYNGNRYLTGLLILWQCAEFAVATWLFTFPGEGPLPVPYLGREDFYLCTNISSPSLSSLNSLFFWLQSGFDVTVIFLTLWNLFQREQVSSVGNLLSIIRRDGLLYFAGIFASNLTWVIMIIAAPVGLKYIAAPITGVLTVVLICRITLNLRESAEAEEPASSFGPLSSLKFSKKIGTPDTSKRMDTAKALDTLVSDTDTWLWSHEATLENDNYEMGPKAV